MESTPDNNDDSSDDKIPVAQLARYKLDRFKMGKNEIAIANPNKDLSVGSTKGSTEGSTKGSTKSSSKARDDSDSESEDSDYQHSDYNGEEDAIAQRRYLNRQRLEHGRARAAVGEPLLHPIHPNTTTKKPKPTNEQVALWENC